MKKLLLIAALFALCALLEVPQDYEWKPDEAAAMLTGHALKSPVSTEAMEAAGGLSL